MNTPTLTGAGAAQRLDGLDALRAFAVLAVIAFHLELPGVFQAGFLGVDVFFTLSGFLITALMCREWRARGRVDLPAFYGRRSRRLFPAALVLVITCVLLSPWLLPGSWPRTQADALAALLYLSNLWQIHAGQSYFETFGHPPLLQHLWSLAVEEQYYLAWPLLFALLLPLLGPRGVGGVALVLALLSTLWMAWVFEYQVQGGDPSRAYLGTDTHAMGLLAGSALACVWNPWHARVRPPWQRALACAVAAAAVAGLCVLMLQWTPAQPWLYQGGFLLCSALTGLAIVGLSFGGGTSPGGGSGAAMRSGALRRLGRAARAAWLWMGTRAYSLYLWHWPVFVLLEPGRSPEGARLPSVVLSLGLTGLAAEASYRWVELTFRATSMRMLWRERPAAVSALCAGLCTALALVMFWRPVEAEDAAVGTARRAVEATSAPAPAASSAPAAARESALDALAKGDGRDVLLLGDSVMLGARAHLQRKLPGVVVDAEVGRQAGQGLRIVQELREASLLPRTVVLHFGTNGYFDEGTLRRLLRELARVHTVVLINNHGNRRWIDHNNELLSRVLAEFPGVRLLDWHQAATEHPEYLVADGIHLSGDGIAAYARAIRMAANLPLLAPVPGTAASATASGDASARQGGKGRDGQAAPGPLQAPGQAPAPEPQQEFPPQEPVGPSAIPGSPSPVQSTAGDAVPPLLPRDGGRLEADP